MAAIWWGCAFLAGAVMGWAALPSVALLSTAFVIRSAVSGDGCQQRMLATGLLAMVALGALRAPTHEAPSFDLLVDGGMIRGTVVGGVTRANGRQRFALHRVAQQGGSGAMSDVEATFRVSAPALPEVRPGDLVRVDGRVDPLDALSNSYRSYLSQHGFAGAIQAQRILRIDSEPHGFYVFDTIRLRMDRVLQGSVPGDAGALLAGLVTGDDKSLSDRRQEAFRIAGLSHVTAISGSNVALLSTVLAGRKARSARQRKGWLLVVVVAVIWGYALIVQMEPPVVRASLMASMALVGVRLGRKVDYITLTVLSAVAMVLVDPTYLRGLAFQLSFVSATALVLSAQADDPPGKLRQVGRAALAVSVAQVAILPLVLPIQQHLSLTAIPANLIVGPLVAIAFALGLLASVIGLVWLPAGAAIAATAGMLTEAILRIVDVFGSPRAVVPLWTMSLGGLTVMAMVTAAGVWVASGEGRRLMRRWRSELPTGFRYFRPTR